MLQIDGLTFRWGGRVLLEQTSATVPTGHRVALVGANGTGKTTLLRLIAGELTADGGAIVMPPRWRIGRLTQEAPGGPDTLLDTVLAFDRERAALLAEAERLHDRIQEHELTHAPNHAPENRAQENHAPDHGHDALRIAEVQNRLVEIGAHAAPARAATILAGLGFDAAAQARPCASFSGGWRMRVALAGVLFTQPDLLLLDEPTNHLDLEATVWLEDYLRAYPYTLLVVSHDRRFLDTVPTGILHLSQNTLTYYTGGYRRFVAARAAEQERREALHRRQNAQREHLQAFVDRFRAKATKARQAQSRVKALEKLEPVARLVDEQAISFTFPDPGMLAPPLLCLEDVEAGYDGRPVLRRLSLRLDQDERVALLGPNGNGKSTLMKVLAGRLAPLAGQRLASNRLRVGYFAQDQAEALDSSLTPVAQLQAIMPSATETQVRGHLGRFGFSGERAQTPVASLSGGEKARLVFALISRETPHLLLLDEPTNHLDIGSREALVEAINTFEGAVVLVSHDSHLIELCADRLWLVGDGTCRPFDGDLDDYRRWLGEAGRAERSASRGSGSGADGEGSGGGTGSGGPPGDGDGGANRRDLRRAAAENRQQLAPLRRRAAQQESLVGRLTADKQRLLQALADPALYSGPPATLTRLQIELGDTERRIGAAEDAWLDALAALEAAEGGV